MPKVYLNVANSVVAGEAEVKPELSSTKLRLESADFKVVFSKQDLPWLEVGDRATVNIVVFRAKPVVVEDEPLNIPPSAIILPPKAP